MKGQNPTQIKTFTRPKTTQIKDFASPILAAVYTAHQAKRLVDAPAVHRPESAWAHEHVPAQNIGFAHALAADTYGVPKDMNG